MPRTTPHSEESKEKMRKKAQERWDTMSPEYEIWFRKRRSKGMKKYWKNIDKEMRKERERKRKETLKQNRLRKQIERELENE